MKRLTAGDGFKLSAYRADPEGAPRGGIVVIQEIFGVNAHIREVCDRLAALGYVAVAPALFDRIEPDFRSGYSEEEVAEARKFIPKLNWDAAMLDMEAARAEAATAGSVGVVGFCLGGVMAFLAATRLDGVAAASGFYGGRIHDHADEAPSCPTQLHYGAEDAGIPLENVEIVRAKRPDCDLWVYEGAGHGFHCDQRASHHPHASAIAWARTVELFAKHVAAD